MDRKIIDGKNLVCFVKDLSQPGLLVEGQNMTIKNFTIIGQPSGFFERIKLLLIKLFYKRFFSYGSKNNLAGCW